MYIFLVGMIACWDNFTRSRNRYVHPSRYFNLNCNLFQRQILSARLNTLFELNKIPMLLHYWSFIINWTSSHYEIHFLSLHTCCYGFSRCACLSRSPRQTEIEPLALALSARQYPGELRESGLSECCIIICVLCLWASICLGRSAINVVVRLSWTS